MKYELSYDQYWLLVQMQKDYLLNKTKENKLKDGSRNSRTETRES
jgi:hypothetical protein